MNTTRMRLLAIVAVTALAAAAPARAGSSALVTGLTGSLLIHQSIPCHGTVNASTSVTGGQILFSPAEGIDVPGGKSFSLTRATVSFAPFSVTGACDGVKRTRTYEEIGVQLARALTFRAIALAPNVYVIIIPKDEFVFYEATIVNGELETGYKHPSEDVTGTIDLAHRTVQMHVVLTETAHFEAGCIPLVGCAINEDDPGTLTADIVGVISAHDVDGDGVADAVDNCRFTPNPDQSSVATPIVAAPGNVTVASCLERHIGFAMGTDVCDHTGVNITDNAPATFSIGDTIVTWTGTDGKNRSASATQMVTVVDQTKPTFTSAPPDITVNTCGPVSLVTPTATDDCAGAPVVTGNAPPSFLVGTTPVVWTATDVSGNAATATQNVTVADTTPPAVACTPAAPPGHAFRVSASDACDPPTIRLGDYVLAPGEHIKIEETGQAGVRSINLVGPHHIRHFHVGKGQAVITATDASGNVGTAVCR